MATPSGNHPGTDWVYLKFALARLSLKVYMGLQMSIRLTASPIIQRLSWKIMRTEIPKSRDNKGHPVAAQHPEPEGRKGRIGNSPVDNGIPG